MHMWQYRQKGIIFWLLTGIVFNGTALSSHGEASNSDEIRKPLRVVVRPRIPKQEMRPLLNPEILRDINENGLKFKWENILNNHFLSGYEDDESLQKFGYTTNSRVGHVIRDKMRITDDPDNMLHLKEYGGRQIYAGASLVIINPMRDIQRGCKNNLAKKCGFRENAQYWLRHGLRYIDISRDRADNSLVNLIRSID